MFHFALTYPNQSFFFWIGKVEEYMIEAERCTSETIKVLRNQRGRIKKCELFFEVWYGCLFFFSDSQAIEQKVKCPWCLTLWYFKNWKRLQSLSQWMWLHSMVNLNTTAVRGLLNL